jgi:hypothetical protein
VALAGCEATLDCPAEAERQTWKDLHLRSRAGAASRVVRVAGAARPAARLLLARGRTVYESL